MVFPPTHCPLKIPLPCQWEVHEFFLLSHAQFVVYVLLQQHLYFIMQMYISPLQCGNVVGEWQYQLCEGNLWEDARVCLVQNTIFKHNIIQLKRGKLKRGFNVITRSGKRSATRSNLQPSTSPHCELFFTLPKDFELLCRHGF